MLDLFLSEGFFPFTLSLAFLFGLLALELVASLLGGTLLGAGAELDGPDIDLPDADFDIDLADLGDLGADADALDLSDFDATDSAVPNGADATTGLSAWLGFGKMPAAIWLASVLMAFGLVGVTVQTVADGILGATLPALIVATPAGATALWFARSFGGLFARALPKTETQALSERHLGRRSGIVSQGDAARGRPAEVRVADRYGNTHYLRAEPLRDEAVIAQGTKVAVLRHRYEGGYRLVPLT